jgi:protein-disulfide isomerase
MTIVGGILLGLGACSPACTAPDAQGPVSSQPSTAANSGSDKPELPMPPPEEMIEEAKGVDLGRLSESQRTVFFQILNTEPSACDQPHSLAKSLRDDAKCRDSLIAAQFVADRLASGATAPTVKEELEVVLDALTPRELVTQGRPVYGNERAPITLVVFADFECPGCKAEVPQLRAIVDQFRGRVRLVFKHFPLRSHPRAKAAAIACEAAHEQGKFWEMHDVVFAHQEALEDEDLARYAKQIGLDVGKFEEALKSRRPEKVVDADRAEGEKAGIPGTPSVFVNGRFATELLFGGTTAGWVDDALKR